MKYFLDTEFHEYEKQPKLFGFNIGKPVDTIELISIGIICEDGREYYAVCNEFDVQAAWNNVWLRGNVLSGIYEELVAQLSPYEKTHFHIPDFTQTGLKQLVERFGISRQHIATEIVEFTHDEVFRNFANARDEFHARTSEYGWNLETPIEFYAYYADYDWVVFCWLFGRMTDLPKEFPMYCRDLKQMLDDQFMFQVNKYDGMMRLEAWLWDVKSHPDYPKQENEHNALADARWNKALYEFLQHLSKRYQETLAA